MAKTEEIEEKWKKIPGFGESYCVGDQGNVRHANTYERDAEGNYTIIPGKILKGSVNWGGYRVVSLKVGRKLKTCLVHRLVCEAFLNNPKQKPYVNHKNGVKDDNRLENLEWCTHSENMRHASKLRKSLGKTRETKAVAPEPYVYVPGTPEKEYLREKWRLTITELHYKDKIKKREIKCMPESMIQWRKEFEALEFPGWPEE